MDTKMKDRLLWAHSLPEYQMMFALSDEDLNKSILDYAAGAASFSADMRQKGHNMIACDALYGESADVLSHEIDVAYHALLMDIEHRADCYCWPDHQLPSIIVDNWHQCAQTFLADYPGGLKENRYCSDQPDQLPFEEAHFDLALCSHFLFDHPQRGIDLVWLLKTVRALAHCAKEVRIFPLLNAQGDNTDPELIGQFMLTLQQQHFGVEVKEVAYEFQRGGNAMMRIWPQACEVSSS